MEYHMKNSLNNLTITWEIKIRTLLSPLYKHEETYNEGMKNISSQD